MILTNKEQDIYLRPMTIEDSRYIVEWRNRPEIKKYFIYQGEFTIQGQQEWIKNYIEKGLVKQFMIVKSENNDVIGSVYLRDIDYKFKKAEFGIFFGKEYGKGYGTKAAKIMIKYAFEELKLHRIYLRVFADNARALASYNKVGFKREGILHDDVYVDNKYRDIVWMAIINNG